MVLNHREYKGIKLLSLNSVQQIDPSKFLVRSEKDPNKNYEVSWAGKQWVCTCEDYRKRQKRCKPIYAASYYLAVRGFVPALESNSQSEQSCPNCESTEALIGHGWRHNKSGPVRRCLCRQCGTTFTDRSGFEGMKNQAKIIAMAIDLYFRGLSLRKVSEHLETLHGVKVSYTSIYYWLSKYVSLVNNLVQDLRVETGERLHADDSQIRLRGRHMVLWELLGSETRLLIAQHISRKRSSEEALTLLKRGCANTEAPRNNIVELVTDGLSSYAEAVKGISVPSQKARRIVHILGPLTCSSVNNNKVERMFGTLKERAKLTKHFNNDGGAELFANGFKTHYNFVRGHMALGGRTPAEAAGLSKRKLSWLDLIGEASSKRRQGRRKPI